MFGSREKKKQHSTTREITRENQRQQPAASRGVHSGVTNTTGKRHVTDRIYRRRPAGRLQLLQATCRRRMMCLRRDMGGAQSAGESIRGPRSASQRLEISAYSPERETISRRQGCQSTRTLAKSYHAKSYPSQLVPNTNSYPTSLFAVAGNKGYR